MASMSREGNCSDLEGLRCMLRWYPSWNENCCSCCCCDGSPGGGGAVRARNSLRFLRISSAKCCCGRGFEEGEEACLRLALMSPKMEEKEELELELESELEVEKKRKRELLVLRSLRRRRRAMAEDCTREGSLGF